MVTSGGQVIVGGGTGRTSTLKLHWAVPQLFEAMHVTAWLPKGIAVPDGGTQVTVVPAGMTIGNG
jgi:hypothetical protein